MTHVIVPVEPTDDAPWSGHYPVQERAFHVVRVSDGLGPETFRAKDRATLSSFPAKDRDDAHAMARALNRMVTFHVGAALLSSPRVSVPGREEIARVLYERERQRGEHANAVLSQATGKTITGCSIEPWEECAEAFLGDADAVLALFNREGKS